MGQYANSGKGTMAVNPILPAALYPGDDIYILGTSFVAGQPPTPGQIQTPNDSNVNFEAFAIGARSLAVVLASRPGGGAPPGVIIQITANANPGVMEIDVQDAAIDADGAYLTNASATNAWKITTWTATNDGKWTAWTELQPEGTRFMSLKCITNPNAVSLTAKVSYV